MATPIANKTYRFNNVDAPTRRLNLYSSGSATDGTNVVLYTADSTNEQQWLYSNNRLYIKTNTKYCLDRFNSSSSINHNNADVWQALSSEDANQKITFVDGGSYVKIKLANTALYLTAKSNDNGTGTGKTKDSTGNVYWASSTNDPLQRWTFSEVSSETSTTTQKLIVPLLENYITMGYKGDAYNYNALTGFGTHYAIDIVRRNSTNEYKYIYASGNGEIVGTKTFRSLGKVIAVQYDNVLNTSGKNIGSVVFRYCHCESFVKTSGKVTKGEHFATMGNTGTGAGSGNTHIHLEVDSDCSYPLMTPTEGGGVDSTVDPFSILYKSSTHKCSGVHVADGNGTTWADGRYSITKINNMPTA